MTDRITYCKQNIVIDKNTGKYTFEDEKEIIKFGGKTRPNPLNNMFLINNE